MKVGHAIETKRAAWSFQGDVAETFVDHVRQSVPLYTPATAGLLHQRLLRPRRHTCYESASWQLRAGGGAPPAQAWRALGCIDRWRMVAKPRIAPVSRTCRSSATMPSRIRSEDTSSSRTTAFSSSTSASAGPHQQDLRTAALGWGARHVRKVRGLTRGSRIFRWLWQRFQGTERLQRHDPEQDVEPEGGPGAVLDRRQPGSPAPCRVHRHHVGDEVGVFRGLSRDQVAPRALNVISGR
jgi:hypothetical protein